MTRAIVLLLLFFSMPPVLACELCDGPGSSFVGLQEHFAKWPQVAIGEPVGRTGEGHAEFRILRTLKGELPADEKIAPKGVFAVLPGHAWLLLGPKDSRDGWSVLMLRPVALDFVKAVPGLPPKDQPGKRLRALVPWLTHADPMVAASARKEFAEAPFSALREAASAIKPADLVKVLSNPRASPASRGALFLLLGVAGGERDRRGLARWMREPQMQGAPGYDALLAAWLMLAGSSGLDFVHGLLANPKSERAIIGSAFVRALGFHARNKAGLGRTEIVAALRHLLDFPSFFGATIDELIKIKAWDELERVLAALEKHQRAAPWMLGPTLRYLAAHPGKDAKRKREQLEASLFEVPKSGDR